MLIRNTMKLLTKGKTETFAAASKRKIDCLWKSLFIQVFKWRSSLQHLGCFASEKVIVTEKKQFPQQKAKVIELKYCLQE